MKIHAAISLTFILLLGANPAAAKRVASSCKSVKIDGVPHVLQKPDFCGEACVEMYLNKLGHKITQDDVFNASGLDPIHARGCRTVDLARALTALGFKPGKTWYVVKANAKQEIREQWQGLHTDLLKNIPSIVCMRTSNDSSSTEHFRLVLGYDSKKDEVIYNEPAETPGAYKRMKLTEFLGHWPLKYKKETWTVIRLKLEVDKKIRQPDRTEGFSNADFVQHIMELKPKIPPKGFTVVLQKPFVVIGDESPAMVRMRADKTVKWATHRLKKMFFRKEPKHIIDIWLFKDDKSYKKHAWEIFGDKPDTPFGYSSSVHRALIMNIGTGGGTLVHEIVHPFMAANFPECPSWLNEGLGSLYEQSRGRGSDIVGMTNWRLAGLQTAIKKRRVPSFKELTSTTTYQFYEEDKGTNYAQARYLCYYLQEKDLLTKFYHKFKENHEKDPTGHETLKEVLREKDMNAFKKKWEKYILSLRFP